MKQPSLLLPRRHLASLLSLACASSAFAADLTSAPPAKADGDATLPVVMTTATRTETSVDSAPGSVSVVTRDDIDKAPRASIKELVRNQEGVITGQLRGVSDLSPEITVRGIPNQARTMLLIDGIPMNTSYSGQAQALGGIDTEDLKQVEIVRGPFSSLYGSAAMGGVVNFITAMPESSEYKASMGYGDAFEDGRAQRMTKGHLSAAQKFNDRLKAKVSYGWVDSDGYQSDFVTTATAPTGVTGFSRQPTNIGGTQYVLGNKGNGAIERRDLTTKVELKPGDLDVLTMTYMQSEVRNQFNDPQSYLRDGAGNIVFSAGTNPRQSAFLSTINEMNNDIYAIDWRHRFADSRLSVKLSNLQVDEWYSQAAATTPLTGGAGTLTPRYSENTLLDMVWEKPIGNSLLLLGGGYKRTRSIADTYNMSDWVSPSSKTSQTTSSGGKERVIALFADWQAEFSEKIGVSLGGRFERWTGFDGYTADYTAPSNTTLNQQYAPQTKTNFSPKLSGSYRLTPSTRLKASWGTAFRAPDALVLYRNYGTTTQYVSNPALKPETSESVDLGIEQETVAKGLFKAYLFHTQLSDMISTRDLNARGTIKERINVGKAKTEGIELSLVQPLTQQVKLTTNYTRTNSRVIENEYEPNSVGQRLTSVPRDMFNLGISYDDNTVYGLMNYQYMSKRYFNSSNNDTTSGVLGSYDPYHLVNAKVGYRFTKQFDLSLAVSNLLDKEFYNSIKTEGRAWFLQATVKY
jgi:iron complex outermembrane recepter protein